MKEEIERMEEKAKKVVKDTSHTFLDRSSGYVLAGLGFVVGLAWNDAIQTLVRIIFPLDKNTVAAKFIYALLATLLIILVSGRLNKK